jgi:predicted Zn-dependent peptidase
MLDEVDADGRDIDVDNLTKAMAFAGHPLAFKIAGTPATVRAMTHARLHGHHQQFYCGSNIVLAAAGPVKHGEVLDLARQHLGALPKGSPARDEPPPEWPAGPRLIVVDHEESQTELRLSFPVPPENHPDFSALMGLRRILDDGLSTRLQVNLVDRKGLAYAVHAGLDTFSDIGTFELDIACAPAKVPAACAEILRTLGETTRELVQDEELERAKIRHRIGFEFSLDSASDLAGWFGGSELFHAPESFEDRIAKFDALTPDDIQRVARATFRRGLMLVAIVGDLTRSAKRELETIVQEATELPE